MNYYNHFTSYCIPSKTSDSLKFHIFVKMLFYSTHPLCVQLSLVESVQIAGSYRQHYVEAYIQLNSLHSVILNLV